MSLKAPVAAAILMLALGLSACGRSDAVSASKNNSVVITAVSNRADLISGDDALIRIDLPKGVDPAALTVKLGGQDITDKFTSPEPGQAVGLVDSLTVGENVLDAHVEDGRGARLTITNHPKGGPVFAGPQVQPWTCTTEDSGLGAPLDEQCNAPTQVSYLYQPAGAKAGAYKDYDPQNPPSDVATTTTDAGVETPYILRVETGTLDRTIYRIMVLADPAQAWTPTEPQQGWNRKLFVSFGGGCGTPHKQTAPPDAGNLIFGNTASDGQIQQPELLARGWMAVGAGLFTFNQNCNETVSAEALMMVKEHIVESYGQIERTISAGGSGGSIQQHYIASAYPGLLDGIVPTQSFADLWALVWDSAECGLLTHYFLVVSPQRWLLPWQQSAVTGKTGPVACTEFIALLNDAFDPQNRGLLQLGILSVRPGCQLPPAQLYDPTSNPTGVRCSVQDYQNAIWGHSGPRDAAPIPYDNTGVQYGLNAVQDGRITAEQFVDLNTKIGGIDNEGNFTEQRTSMSEEMATTMYRTSHTTDPRQLARVPILDIRQTIPLLRPAPELLSDMHQPYHSYVTRARLDDVNGTHANQVFWRIPPDNMDVAAVLEVDRWLQAVDDDTSNLSRVEKIIRQKPADIVDTCWIGNEKVTDVDRCDARYPHGSDARISAGSPFRDDIRKCQLKPLNRDDYSVTFSDDQWKRLQSVFADGVCDWDKPSVGYEPSIPWMTYAGGPGGTPLGQAPVSVPY